MRESATAPQPVASRDDAARAAAFQTLADQQIHESYRLAMAILGHRQAAQDAVHDAFVKAWERWPSLHDHSRFAAWFQRILVNTCRDQLRGSRRRDAADIAGHVNVAAPDEMDRVDERVRVEGALRRLKPDDQVLFALRYYLDLELSDVAQLLEIPTGTVKSRLNAAHSRLRSVLERAEGSR